MALDPYKKGIHCYKNLGRNTPELKARVSIDALLAAAGWHVCNMAQASIHVARGVALREFPLNPCYGIADYLLYIDGKVAGVIETKKEGITLMGVEVISARCMQGLDPSRVPAPCLPFTGLRLWPLGNPGLRPTPV